MADQKKSTTESDRKQVDDQKCLLQAPDQLGLWLSSTSHHWPTITLKSCDKTTSIMGCMLCHCCWLMWFDVVFCVTAEYKTLCPGGEGFRPNPITVILEGQTATSYHVFVWGYSCVHLQTLTQITPTHNAPECFLFFLWQTSMSARSCQACAREDSASTPLAASSVNVQEATPSTQKPESVKVLDTHMYFCAASQTHEHTGDLFLSSSCPGMFQWEGNWVQPSRPLFSEDTWRERKEQKDQEILDLFVP